MTARQPISAQQTYPIGVVSRLTGILPTTLRIWERRYELVRPGRTQGRGRLYSEDDVRRLTLIKALVDAGHQISLLAPLTIEQLRERLERIAARTVSPGSDRLAPTRVVILGHSLPERLKVAGPIALMQSVEFVGNFRDEDELVSSAMALHPDIVVLECATIHEDAVGKVRLLLARVGVKQAVLVYGIASGQALQDLCSAGVICLRATVPLSEFVSACRGAHKHLPSAMTTLAPSPSEPGPPRRFSPEQLARISARVPVIACECPQHLVELINSMAAFETYSRECESRNTADAQMHAFLSATASRSRAMLEAALERVAEFEGIDVG